MSTTENLIPSTNYQERFKDFEYPSPELLNPGNHSLILIDHEGQMIFPVESIPKLELRNNVAILAYYSKVYEIPTILSTIVEKGFAGPILTEIRQYYPEAPIYDRISMNLWEDTNAREAVIAIDKKRLVMAGLWTDVCLGFTVLSALKAGYEVYIITDASGATSVEAHQIAIQRMVQAGAIPITTSTYVSEILRDYGRADNAAPDIGALLHDGLVKYMNFGIGIDYADHMVPAYPTYTGFNK
ncbi:isochorismatase family protein [Sphingobacterium kitahiroshimense]|uniref:isochorismatase family protein n=1 Tax=Sphingobacterium kitahiroshimense TaxID=470446 RepID=UPI003209A355